jgi:flagellar motor switch protein FliM
MAASETDPVSLSQEDIDRLMASEAEATKFPAFKFDGSSLGTTEDVKIETVDFRNPTLLSEGELRRLRSAHEEYVRTLASRVSSVLRAELGLRVARFTTQPYEDFLGSLKSLTHLSLFRVAPLSGVGILEIPPRLAMAFTNRILGGREQAPDLDVVLTEIEVALLEDVIAIITEEWCRQWKEGLGMEASLIAHETNPRFVQACPKGTMMLVLAIDATFDGGKETIQIAVPFAMIEPIMERKQAARVQESSSHGAERSAIWRKTYDEISIPVHAEFSAAQMTVEALLNLKVGDVIEAPRSSLERTRVCVSGAVHFIGNAGQHEERVAVQITSKTASFSQ